MRSLREMLRHQAAPGTLMLGAACLAMVAANSPLAAAYGSLLQVPFEVRLGAWELAKPVLLWINDGLMALCFLFVGLELKREMLYGHMSDRRQVVLPASAAGGGMAMPALIYTFFNRGDPVAMSGWAIPAATDIAFALGVLALLGPRVPPPLKLFLLTVAIFDDIGAILIIAFFYTDNLATEALMAGGMALAALALLNRAGVRAFAPYVLVGAVLWLCVLESGVHATLAGVALALLIPADKRAGEAHPPLVRMEHGLSPWVSFLILPVFAFANAGVSLAGVGIAALLAPIPAGIALGLLLGNPIGIFGLVFLSVRLLGLPKPPGVTWNQLLGTSMLCGIGFTMSLFISALAFESGGAGEAEIVADRLGILMGSLSSALLGYVWLRRALPARAD